MGTYRPLGVRRCGNRNLSLPFGLGLLGETGTLWLKGIVAQGPEAQCRVRLTLRDGVTVIKTAEVSTAESLPVLNGGDCRLHPGGPTGLAAGSVCRHV